MQIAKLLMGIFACARNDPRVKSLGRSRDGGTTHAVAENAMGGGDLSSNTSYNIITFKSLNLNFDGTTTIPVVCLIL